LFHWDNYYTPYVFNPPTGASVASAGLKNDVVWTWTLPGTTAATDIPIGTEFHPGLGLDAANWNVPNCSVSDISGFVQLNIPLTVAHPMNNSLIAFPAVRGSESSSNPGQSTYYNPGTNFSCGRGFSIIASDTPQTVISLLQFADVTGMGLTLSNLNAAGLRQLQTNKLVTTVTDFGVHTLAPNARFVVLLQGEANCVPADVATNGNYLVMNRPDLLTRELYLVWNSTDSVMAVQNFALLSVPPVGNFPALTINRQGTNSVLLAWDHPSVGFVLQSTTNLVTKSWANVSTVPTVALSSSLGVYQNQVTVSPASGIMFYRLMKP
jgi:hypothetical protein